MIDEYISSYMEHYCLILRAVAPDCLQVSKQRFSQIEDKYNFWSKEFFGKTWYSRKELERFHKVERPTGVNGSRSKPASALTIASKIKQDLLD